MTSPDDVLDLRDGATRPDELQRLADRVAGHYLLHRSEAPDPRRGADELRQTRALIADLVLRLDETVGVAR